MNGTHLSKTLRILVVENDADTLWALRIYLEDSGYYVSAATNVHDAAELLRDRDFDVLICDIGLPDGTAWDLVRAGDASSRRFFAISMSGFGMNADSARSRAAGFRRHLLKPFKAAELDHALAEASAEVHEAE